MVRYVKLELNDTLFEEPERLKNSERHQKVLRGLFKIRQTADRLDSEIGDNQNGHVSNGFAERTAKLFSRGLYLRPYVSFLRICPKMILGIYYAELRHQFVPMWKVGGRFVVLSQKNR